MECDDAEELLASLFDANCDQVDAQHLALHLSECSDCLDLLTGFILSDTMERVAHEQWSKQKIWRDA